MDVFLTIIMFILGLVLIIYGGNFLVESSLKISKITGISEIIIGATIVSLATTLPELLVTIFSSMNNQPDIAIGNCVGSMFINLSVILGITLMFQPSRVSRKSFNVRFIILLVTNILILVFGFLGKISILSGCVLLMLFAVYFIYNFISAKSLVKNNQTKQSNYVVNSLHSASFIQTMSCENSTTKTCNFKPGAVTNFNAGKPVNKKLEFLSLLFLFTIGAIGVSMGSNLLVENGEKLAYLFHISPAIVGATVIAIGTSLPELVTAITSIKRKSTGLAVGTIIGANILNGTLLLGTASLFGNNNLTLSKSIAFIEMPLLVLGLFILAIPIFKREKTYKWQGLLLILIAVVYYLLMFLL